jgi:hypothetical protein
METLIMFVGYGIAAACLIAIAVLFETLFD